jgi:hypothetical protein
VINDGHRTKGIRANCKQWHCDECRPHLTRKLRKQILAGEPNMMITLTQNGSRGESKNHRRRLLGEAIPLLFQMIKRSKNLDHVPYFCVIEQHESGEAHAHILARLPYVHQKWLLKKWRKLMGAAGVFVQRLKTQRGAAHYVSKYLSKAPARFGTMKRFWKSQHWRVTPEEARDLHDTKAFVRVLKHFNITKYAALLISEGWQITKRFANMIEAEHPGGPRAPPLWSCTVEPLALQGSRHR